MISEHREWENECPILLGEVTHVWPVYSQLMCLVDDDGQKDGAKAGCRLFMALGSHGGDDIGKP
jgi:hypothetical protein